MVAMQNVPYVGNDDTGNRKNQFEAMLGRQVDGLAAHTGAGANEYTQVSWFAQVAVGGQGRKVWYTVPLVPQGSTLEQAAGGTLDSAWRTIAQILNANRNGATKINVRTGEEHNGTWMPRWYAGNRPATYVAAHRRFVSVFRSVNRDGWEFVWCPNYGENVNLANTYPGDDVIDEIGVDFYWYPQYLGNSAASAWNTILNHTYGLNYFKNRTYGRNKPLVIDEYGGPCGTHDAENAKFIKLCADWFKANKVLRHGWFDEVGANEQLSGSSSRPQSQAAHRTAFLPVFDVDLGTTTPTTPTTPTTNTLLLALQKINEEANANETAYSGDLYTLVTYWEDLAYWPLVANGVKSGDVPAGKNGNASEVAPILLTDMKAKRTQFNPTTLVDGWIAALQNAGVTETTAPPVTPTNPAPSIIRYVPGHSWII